MRIVPTITPLGKILAPHISARGIWAHIQIVIEPPEEIWEQEIGEQNKLITTKFQIEIENRKVKGLITYSTELQIFKFKVNSENNQEL